MRKDKALGSFRNESRKAAQYGSIARKSNTVAFKGVTGGRDSVESQLVVKREWPL